jgi:hypothetical protein
VNLIERAASGRDGLRTRNELFDHLSDSLVTRAFSGCASETEPSC